MHSGNPQGSHRSPIRSSLFVPADNQRKLEKSLTLGADALIFDLEDAVLPARKREARSTLAGFLREYRGPSQPWIRVNDLASGELLADLGAVIQPGLAGVVLPKLRGPEDLERLGHYLDAVESMAGCAPGATRILAVCTETPIAVLRMAELAKQGHARLTGLIWGAEDLSSALGAGDPRGVGGVWHPLYEQARAQCLLAAHALGIEAIDTVYVDIRNSEGCRSNAELARRDGFTGKVAVHPDQVLIINDAFTPKAEEVAYAQRVVGAFSSGAGAVSLDGRMLDVPHLRGAERVLRAAGVL
jgi:citrate lyase subunit beta/citryl-CoA lyase